MPNTLIACQAGLDDAFIISCSFFRTDQNKSIEERVRVTVDDIGVSIFLTTLTSSLAFGIGFLSAVPAVFWLCVYAVPTIIFVLLWQLTFFMSCLVLDERRVVAKRRDCLRCCSGQSDEAENAREDVESENITLPKSSRIDNWMEWYAEHLLHSPWVKSFVIVSFVAIAAACAVSTSSLKQEFQSTDILPDDRYVAFLVSYFVTLALISSSPVAFLSSDTMCSTSYIHSFLTAWQEKSGRSSVIFPQAYFRYVNQSDPTIQDQMERYVADLVTIDAIVEQPSFFWVWDFRSFVEQEDLTGLSFRDQMLSFLGNPIYHQLYQNDIVLDPNDSGTIIASRLTIPMDNVGIFDVGEQINALEDQERVTAEQPINQEKRDYVFFTYEEKYKFWQFYANSSDEVIVTTLTGVGVVTGVALLLVPHWTAVFFIVPLICLTYADLLGTMQWANVNINPVSYICLLMSIGLLIDYILHFLLRYYEAPGTSRNEKVVNTMRTMGSSILIGAFTTLLGTVPLAFSTSDVFSAVFVAFFGLVVLGVSHGLILLPILLSVFGPRDQLVFTSASTTTTTTTSRARSETAETSTPSDEEDEGAFVAKAPFESKRVEL